jgi:hypothetical protein
MNLAVNMYSGALEVRVFPLPGGGGRGLEDRGRDQSEVRRIHY